jgi:hypothetical protein
MPCGGGAASALMTRPTGAVVGLVSGALVVALAAVVVAVVVVLDVVASFAGGSVDATGAADSADGLASPDEQAGAARSPAEQSTAMR